MKQLKVIGSRQNESGFELCKLLGDAEAFTFIRILKSKHVWT